HMGSVQVVVEDQVEVLQRRIADLERLLVDSQRLATVGNLSARLAHELNNILTPILSLGSIAIRYGDEESKDKSVHKSVELAQRGANLLKGLLNFASNTQRNPEVVMATSLTDVAVGLIDWDLKKDGVQVIKEYETEAHVNVISIDIEQVFLNLILNARQAMLPGGGSLVLRVYRHTPEQVAFQFADSGRGIEPENLGRIFDPFFTTNAEGKGTGLGLAVAQEIVEDAGGTIEVESVMKPGTTFTVYLPAAGGN
ncbi:MAG: ATP-binding protein, partial [Phycisphaerae bacterium]|nr:ATP-binding protein [Phycisphaerae bacterium]